MKYLKHTIKLRFLSLALAMGMFIMTRHARAAEDEANKSTVPASSVTPEVLVTAQTDNRKKSYKSEKVSSSKYTEPLLDIPQTITVVPQAVIQAQSATTLRETLRNVPGISMQAGEGGVPAGDQLSIRGSAPGPICLWTVFVISAAIPVIPSTLNRWKFPRGRHLLIRVEVPQAARSIKSARPQALIVS